MTAPRLAFVGLGWIGAMRMDAVATSGRATVAALCEPAADRLEAAGEAHPGAERFTDFDDLLEKAEDLALDGVVIATPNALHAPQATAALDRGLAVFCQKPLALNAAEAREIVEAARRADRLLGVDYSYRHTDGARKLRELARSGELGRIFNVESTFHNAYGPDKTWCHDPNVAGGGALIDLGVHQIDLPLWILGDTRVREVRGCAFYGGERLGGVGIDDFTIARIELENRTIINLAVSWNAHAGRDCVIRTGLFGTAGGAEFRNVGGSFYDFEVERHRGRIGEVIVRESRDWLGRGIVAWAERLAETAVFDPEVKWSIVVAEVVDAIYGSG